MDGEGRTLANESLTRHTQAPPALHNDLGVRNGSARSSRASWHGSQRACTSVAGRGITINQTPERNDDLEGFKTSPGPISPRSPTDSDAPSEYSDATGIDDPKGLPYQESGPPRPGNLNNSFAKDWTRIGAHESPPAAAWQRFGTGHGDVAIAGGWRRVLSGSGVGDSPEGLRSSALYVPQRLRGLRTVRRECRRKRKSPHVSLDFCCCHHLH